MPTIYFHCQLVFETRLGPRSPCDSLSEIYPMKRKIFNFNCDPSSVKMNLKSQENTVDNVKKKDIKTF